MFCCIYLVAFFFSLIFCCLLFVFFFSVICFLRFPVLILFQTVPNGGKVWQGQGRWYTTFGDSLFSCIHVCMSVCDSVLCVCVSVCVCVCVCSKLLHDVLGSMNFANL